MKTTPKPHQYKDFELCKDKLGWAHFWEMGTGKSFMGISQAEYLYEKGEIDALFVVAPPSVHDIWITEQLPAHCDKILWTGHIYHASKASTKKSQQEWTRMLKEKFPVLVMTYPALRTTRGKTLAKKFLKERKCLYICDESHRLKTPGAKVTKTALASSAYAKHKRILSGTSVTNSPFDVYSQIKFLDPEFWPNHGFGSHQSFKTTFGVFEEVKFQKRTETGQVREQAFQKLKYYRNLDYLCQILKEISDRHLTEEVLDLPERTFSRRYFEPSQEQRRIYKEFATDFYAFLEESGEMVTTQLAITRLVRFQQLLSGFLERDAEEGGGRIFLNENPRLDCLLDILENDLPNKKVIIWARFHQDIDFIMDKLGDQAIRFDGQVSVDSRYENRKRFALDPSCLFFVANPAAGGVGLTLNEAQNVIYYTNSFDLEQRLQSEARNFRIGQTGTVNVIDIVARGLPFDSQLLSRLRAKAKMAAKVMGDDLKEWI